MFCRAGIILGTSVVSASTDRRLTLPGVWGIPGLPWQCSLGQEIADYAKALQGLAYNHARLTVPGVQFTGLIWSAWAGTCWSSLRVDSCCTGVHGTRDDRRVLTLIRKSYTYIVVLSSSPVPREIGIVCWEGQTWGIRFTSPRCRSWKFGIGRYTLLHAQTRSA